MEKLCSCCNTLVDSDSAAILALGGYGNVKYLCEECDGYLNTVTRGRDVAEIDEAKDKICSRMRGARIDDAWTLKTISEVLKEATTRRDAIEKGEYDFSAEEESDEAAEEIPEELRETEEDRLAEEKEEEAAKKWDKIITIASAVVFTAVILYLLYRFVAGYFF